MPGLRTGRWQDGDPGAGVAGFQASVLSVELGCFPQGGMSPKALLFPPSFKNVPFELWKLFAYKVRTVHCVSPNGSDILGHVWFVCCF